MKTIIVSCLSIFQILFSVVSFGQTYHPLIQNNTFWDVLNTDMTQVQPCTYHNGFRYYFQGDTLIAGHQYKILRAYSVVSTNTSAPPNLFCPPFAVDTSKKSITGFIREDSIGKKVFINYLDNTGN